MAEMTSAPAQLTPLRPWKLLERPGTGMMVIVEHEAAWGQAPAILCRVDQAAGLLFLFDKVTRKEVCVKVGELFPVKSVV
jgi:hypothetical protein